MEHLEQVAIIGVAGRFPGAKNVDEFWENLRAGRETVYFFNDEELAAEGIDFETLRNPLYVKAAGILDDVDLFDAEFFGYNPREAELMDPQHRFFLECAWEALENAGYNPNQYPGRIGLFASVSTCNYLFNIYSRPERLGLISGSQVSIGTHKDFLTTRVSYKLNLRGPSVNIQTACSSSLVAVHMACQSIMIGESDMALAGGVTIDLPQKSGNFYQEGGILSPDGRCRAFDAKAQGTVGGSGVGVVVLKRLSKAIADGDYIHAIIKGTAVNNDGSHKAGYTAPGIRGQMEVITDAQAVAEVDPESITYIEAHGTGTELGDPIEVLALTKAFNTGTQKKNFCGIGSVKTNIGHLDVAAGIAGLIKTALALEHGMLPPSLHFNQPNPKIDFKNSPFYVNTKLNEWHRNGAPRRAGVSSFGVGGTNAHVILEEPPEPAPAAASWPSQLLLLSARTRTALDVAAANLARHLKRFPDRNLADVAYTLQVGRFHFKYRRALVCKDVAAVVDALEDRDCKHIVSGSASDSRSVVFMFPGQGTQHINMAAELNNYGATFSRHISECADLLTPHLGLDLRGALFPREGREDESREMLRQTWLAQPALFAVEYALAKLWMSWGVKPQAMIGHSVGEYVAACLAGVIELEDALWLIAARGRLMQELPEGAMTAVMLPPDQVRPLMTDSLCLAAVNGPTLCVVSGPKPDVEKVEKQFDGLKAVSRRIDATRAFHSSMMDPILEPFTEQVKKVALKAPQIPYISNLTGTWITPAQATDPSYWARHLREAVLFGDGVTELMKNRDHVFLEVGPRETLCKLVARKSTPSQSTLALATLGQPQDGQSNLASILRTAGELWVAGVSIDWPSLHAGQRRRRAPLPTYPFDRQRYWIDRKGQKPSAALTTSDSSSDENQIQRSSVASSSHSLEIAEPSLHINAPLQAPSIPVFPTDVNHSPFDQNGSEWLNAAEGEGALTGELEEIMSKQLQVMRLQLEVLSSQKATNID